jgi:ankyrin repeat protein
MKSVVLLLLAGLGFAGLAHAIDATNSAATPTVPESPLAVVLEETCNRGEINQIPMLIDQGAPIDLKMGRQGSTPLMEASTRDLSITRFLIGKGAKLDVTDAEGNTALNDACIEGKSDCAMVLIDAGANPNLGNQNGQTPLISAAGDHDDALVKALLAHHADVNQNTKFGSALMWAIYCNQLTTMKLLVDAGAGVNFVPPARKIGSTYAPLHAAASTGNLPAMDFLFDHHANIDLLDSRGFSPLMAAADAGQAEAVQELLDRGAKLDGVCNPLQWTALMLAAHKGYLSVVEALVTSGAKLELKDYVGRTALIIAAKNLQSRVVRLLVDNGANIDATDSAGETALTYAGTRGDTELVKWLADNGAKRTDVHIVKMPEAQPLLSVAKSWALAVGAPFIQCYGANPHLLGYGSSPSLEISQGMQTRWKITDKASLLQVLDDLQKGKIRADWQEKGAKLAGLTDDQFKSFLLLDSAAFATGLENVDATAIRENYLKWKDKIGLGWTLCVYANLVNRGFTLHYLDENQAWDLLLANAREVQGNFGSWREMGDNFLDGREISSETRDNQFEACLQLLLNPKDANSPWNQLPWKTDLTAN